MKSFREPWWMVASVFWLLAILTIPIWWRASQPGWDARVYARAMHWVATGQDPYVEGIAQEANYYAQHAVPGTGIPFAYVYSPMTLPLLKLASTLPYRLLQVEYWFLYAACALVMVLVAMRAAEREERKWIRLFAPAALFFPGLLVNDVVQSGNLAYIVYGLVFATAWAGWRCHRWLTFYVIVVAASCFKAPYLCLLAIPFFSARRQAVPTVLAASAGVSLFAVQAWLWPAVFQHYLRAVELQFVWNRDFGSSPAGQFAALLDALHLPFELASWGFYALYAVPVAFVLYRLGRRYQSGALTLGQWMPLVLLGSWLLNPRHIEYDLAPLTLPMALIALRQIKSFGHAKLALGLLLEHFVAVNVLVVLMLGGQWRTLACFLLCACFTLSARDLMRAGAPAAAPRYAPELDVAVGGHLEAA